MSRDINKTELIKNIFLGESMILIAYIKNRSYKPVAKTMYKMQGKNYKLDFKEDVNLEGFPENRKKLIGRIKRK